MSNATRNLKKNIDDTSDAARRTVDMATDTVSETVASVREGAAERVASARDALAETGDRLAETLRRATDKAPDVAALRDSVVAAVGTGVSATADALRDRSVSDLATDLRETARRHPGLFIAGAAVAGFALARFLSSSRERRS